MTRAIEELIPEFIRGLPVYVPGRPIEEVEQELKIRAIKLASNENPLGPSPMAMEAVKRALPESHRYPDGGTLRLREKLAKLHGVKPEEIFVGLGSSEIIDLSARILITRGLGGMTSEGSYAPFSISIRANGANLTLVPLKEFAYDLKAMARALTPETHIVFLANPNNPTGTAFGHAELEEFLRQVPEDVLVVLDEAYIHYAERTDMVRSVELFHQRSNLLVMRTFSKVYGLAGLRIGYGIGRAAIVSGMNKVRTPFNVTGLTQAAAFAALDDEEHVRRSIVTNGAERKRLCDEMKKMGLRAVRSEANFVFAQIGPEAKAICEELLVAGVIVRPLGWMGMPESMRVSVGTAEENGRFLEVMGRVWAKRAGKSEMATR
jgi:histidinol-phosphate aminotransferase